MEKNKKTRAFYTALVLITLGAAAVGTGAVINMVQQLSETPDAAQSAPLTQEELTWGLNEAEVDTPQSGVPIAPPSSSAAQSAASSQQSLSEPSSAQSEPAAWQGVQAKPFIWPVSGQVLSIFSGDELVYNMTMGDWRTHNGTDLSCENGAEVKAPVDGEIIAVNSDALWGGTVEIKWGDDTVRICGVNASGIKAGDEVKQGDKIGVAADIPAESKETPHIHVEIISNGAPMNPEAYAA